MAGPVSPHPFRPGQICITQIIDPPAYQLPRGLPPGVRVRTLVYDHGFWTVAEVERLEVRWQVFVILLVIEAGTNSPVTNRRRSLAASGL